MASFQSFHGWVPNRTSLIADTLEIPGTAVWHLAANLYEVYFNVKISVIIEKIALWRSQHDFNLDSFTVSLHSTGWKQFTIGKWLSEASEKTVSNISLHWGRDKMATIFQTTFSNTFSWMKILIQISLKYVPMGPIDNNPASVQIMAWRQKGAKPLSEPMMA